MVLTFNNNTIRGLFHGSRVIIVHPVPISPLACLLAQRTSSYPQSILLILRICLTSCCLAHRLRLSAPPSAPAAPGVKTPPPLFLISLHTQTQPLLDTTRGIATRVVTKRRQGS